MSDEKCPHGGYCGWWGRGFTGKAKCKNPDHPVACNGHCGGWMEPTDPRPSVFERLFYGNSDSRACHV